MRAPSLEVSQTQASVARKPFAAAPSTSRQAAFTIWEPAGKRMSFAWALDGAVPQLFAHDGLEDRTVQPDFVAHAAAGLIGERAGQGAVGVGRLDHGIE